MSASNTRTPCHALLLVVADMIRVNVGQGGTENCNMYLSIYFEKYNSPKHKGLLAWQSDDQGEI